MKEPWAAEICICCPALHLLRAQLRLPLEEHLRMWLLYMLKKNNLLSTRNSLKLDKKLRTSIVMV